LVSLRSSTKELFEQLNCLLFGTYTRAKFCYEL
jgi:hypothetical protein